MQGKSTVSIHADFCIFMALLLLIIPLKWGISWIFAAVVHELFHYIALRLSKVDVYAVQITAKGATMETSPFTGSSEVFCALAGPAGSLLLLSIGSYAPRVALCAFLQGAYNLLPIYPLDGGRALRWGLHRLFPIKAEVILRIINVAAVSVLLALSIYAAICLGIGLLPLFMVIGLFYKNKYVNYPCKASYKRVQ